MPLRDAHPPGLYSVSENGIGFSAAKSFASFRWHKDKSKGGEVRRLPEDIGGYRRIKEDKGGYRRIAWEK